VTVTEKQLWTETKDAQRERQIHTEGDMQWRDIHRHIPCARDMNMYTQRDT
jgi:hypothetical protein